MNFRVRAMTGVLTTGLFLVIGFSILEDQPRWGAGLMALGALRGAVVVRQLRSADPTSEPPPDPGGGNPG